jgi:hypothetical protein
LGSDGNFQALHHAGRLDRPKLAIFRGLTRGNFCAKIAGNGVISGARVPNGNTVCIAATFDKMRLSILEVNQQFQSILDIIYIVADLLVWRSSTAV